MLIIAQKTPSKNTIMRTLALQTLYSKKQLKI